MLSVILADDETAIRSALGLVLKQKLSIQQLSEAANMNELLSKLSEAKGALVLLDWELPGLAAQGGLAALRQLYPDLKVVALSARPEARQAALAAGADAFVSKTEPPDTMLRIMDPLCLAPASH
jgi:two-component system, NarL family, invasion response regulator UvrY